MHVTYAARWGGLGLLLLAAIDIGVGLAGYGILNGNECLYVEAAREMIDSGHWIVPQLNGLPYVEKPPLMDWLLAAVFRLVGFSEAAARAVSLGASVLTALALAWLAPRLGIRGAPAAAAYVYLTSLGVVVLASVAMPDALFNGLFGVGCAAFAAALRENGRGLARLAALCIGLAGLTKGLLPLALFALIVLAYVAVTRAHVREVARLGRDPLVWLLLFGPLLAWTVAAEIQLPGAAWRFLVEEHVLRFLGLRQPQDYYSGPVWYYLPRFILFAFPWVAVLAVGWWARRGPSAGEAQPARRFLWLCVWVPLVFFSLSQAKANYYMTLALPAMALLTVDDLQALMRRGSRNGLTAVLALVALPLLLVQAVGAVAAVQGRLPLSPPPGPATFVGSALAALILLALLAGLARSPWRRLAPWGIGLFILPVTLELHALAAGAESRLSARPLATYITANFPHEPVFLYQDYEAYGALPIYLGHTVPVIDSRSNDLYFGARLRPNHPVLATEDAVRRQGHALIVVLRERSAAFRHSGLWAGATPLGSWGEATLYRWAREDSR